IAARNAAGQETAVELLALDADLRRLYWRGRSAGAGPHRLPAGSPFRFDARGYGGVVIRFTVPRAVIVYSDQGEPALASPFPEEVVRIQRRLCFRALASHVPGAQARWVPGDAA